MPFKTLQIINIAINIVLTAILIFTVFSSKNKVIFLSDNEEDKAQNYQTNIVTNIPTGEDLKKFTNFFEIHINDNGYIENDITANLAISKDISVTVINEGKKPHSFVIDPLKINSGEIDPGKSKTILISDIPNETISYSFYSDIDSDLNKNFRGKILVIKK